MEVLQPGSRRELDALICSQYNNDKSTYFRLSDHPHDIELPVNFGKGVIIKGSNSKITVMTAGPILANVMQAVSDLDVNLVYFNTIKPIDAEIINHFKNTKIVVVHDAFGLYESICSVPEIHAKYFGIGDCFYSSYGTLQDIRKEIGLDIQGIRAFLQNEL